MDNGRFSDLSPPGASPQLLWLPNGEVNSRPGDGAFRQIFSWTFQSSAETLGSRLLLTAQKKTSVCGLHWQVCD